MNELEIQTMHNVAVRQRAASIGERLLATLVDLAIIVSYYMAVFLITDQAIYNIGFSVIFVLMLPTFFYHLFCEIFMNGQSFGKKALNIKVIKIDGSSPSVGSYFIRWVFRLIDINLTYGAVAIISIATGKKSQRLGDMVAKTTVISTKSKESLADTIYRDVHSDYEPRYESVKFLDDQDIRTVKDVLDHYYRNRNQMSAVDMLKKTQKAVCKKAGINTDKKPLPFLKTILNDYTALHQ